MDVDVIISALLRRWYLVIVGSVVTAGFVLAAYKAVPPTYYATGTSVVLPAAESIPKGANVLLQLGGLEQPTSLVVAYLAGDTPRKAFAEQYPDVQYNAVVDSLSRGPLIVLTVESPHEDEVVAALETALANVSDALAALQDRVEVPKKARLESSILIADAQPTTRLSKSLRAMIAAAVAGLALTLVAAVVADRLLAQRASRFTDETHEVAEDDETDTDEEEGDEKEEPVPGPESKTSHGWHVGVPLPEP